MGRRPAIEEAGPMIQWSIRTTNRARDALTAAAKARGVSVGIYLDQITHPNVAHTHDPSPLASLILGAHDEPAPAPAKPVPATRTKRTSAEAEADRQATRTAVARDVLRRFDTGLHTQEIGDDPPPGGNPEQCRHPLTEALPTGLRRCRACGLTGAASKFT